jgi:hypothetical protein
MSKVWLGFSIFVLAIFSVYAIHTWNRLSLESDPAVTLALSSARTEAKPLIDALDQYHLIHGVYPRSVKELPKDHLWGKYLYQITPLNAVYKSLECQQRVRNLMGWQTTEKRQRAQEVQEECLLGYSQFVLKTQVQPSHRQMFVFVEFASANPKWDIDWCTGAKHGRNYCYEDLMKLRDENKQ